MTFEAPQIIYTGLLAVGVGISLARYGQPKRDKYDVVDVLIAPALVLTLLYWGGFYG